MRQRFLALLALWLLVACGGPGPTPPPALGSTPSVSQRETITFLASGGTLDRATYTTLLAAFEAQHPGLTVDLTLLPDDINYENRLVTDFASGTPPDVALISYQRLRRFTVRDLLLPLGPRLAASVVISEGAFYPDVLLPFQGNAGPWCLPQTADTLVVYYNRALFDAAGITYPADDWTWPEFVTAALALTRDTNGDGLTDSYGIGWAPTLRRVTPLVWQSGGDLVDSLIYPTELSVNSPPAFKGLRWYTNLQVELKVAPDAVANASEPLADRFLNGRLAMWVETRARTPALRASAAFPWDVAPLPRNWGRRANLLLTSGYCIAAQSPRAAAAWALVEFLASPAGQTLAAQGGGLVPTLPSVAASPAFLDPAQAPSRADLFLSNLAYARITPVLDHWSSVELLVDNELQRAFYGQTTIYEAMNSVVLVAGEYLQGAAP